MKDYEKEQLQTYIARYGANAVVRVLAECLAKRAIGHVTPEKFALSRLAQALLKAVK